MRRRIVLLDTSFIIAIAHAGDPHHERAKLLDAELLSDKTLCVLHWGILMEIADGFARVDRRAKGYTLLERLEMEDRYQISPIADELLYEALMERVDVLQYFQKSSPASVLLTCVPSAWHGKTAKNFSTSLAILHA